MNVSPNVERSAAPFASLGDLTDRMIGGLTSNRSMSDDHSKPSHQPPDGDLKKFSAEILSTKASPLDEMSDKTNVEKKDLPVPVKVEHNPSGNKSDAKKRRARKKWKKPKDKPNRPLSAYNLFFQAERAEMLGDDAKVHEQDKAKKRVHRKTHGKIGFAEMARSVGQKWKELPEEVKKPYLDEAAKEKKRYAIELKAWQEDQKLKPKSGKSLIAALKAESREIDREGASSVGASDSKANNDESLRLRLMTEELKRAEELKQRNMAILQQRSEAEYLIALQERQMALLSGRSSLDSSLFQYPSASEASANAILQQFQYSLPSGRTSMSGMNQMNMNMNMNPMGMHVMNPMGMNPMGMNAMNMNGMNMNSMNMNTMNMNSLGPMSMGSSADFQQMGGRQVQFGATNRLQQLRDSFATNMGDFQAMGSLNIGSNNNANMMGTGQGDLGRLEQLANNEMAVAMARRLQNRFNM